MKIHEDLHKFCADLWLILFFSGRSSWIIPLTYITKDSNEKQTVIMNLNSGSCKCQLIMAALVCQSVTG